MIISIGALGGSGTRAVAEVFIKAGIYMGNDLSFPNDNLIFSRIFKNPEWFKTSTLSDKINRLSIFRKYMQNEALNISELYDLYKAAYSNKIEKSKVPFYLYNLKMLVNNSNPRTIWGWKEPNTHIYLDLILKHYKNIKYIHLIRHGLDMAFSDNKQQLYNWGWLYNINITGNETENELSVKQLDYWIASTQKVLETAKKYNQNILLLNHSNFCNNPISEIDNLLDFCDLKISENERAELYNIPANTGSNNRYIDKDLSIFGSEQLKSVEQYGFKI